MESETNFLNYADQHPFFKTLTRKEMEGALKVNTHILELESSCQILKDRLKFEEDKNRSLLQYQANTSDVHTRSSGWSITRPNDKLGDYISDTPLLTVSIVQSIRKPKFNSVNVHTRTF